eukprot:CAMPEP_0183322176 /NCGR_PEP_ID=MMETSP0160_2-20130417/70920_1 /TAXON_ID=2839 ORGANISM="Odontella Sinensis, Strain Grunow 1884" /NCGR_SAMPLE_ID=MMETSP0160_2 /ASSEMBLY_ACC=CAM_ASM_000250 /LENGTH=103 /DNA_ID=CAMNT_0025489275 /DNA_START=94 /DNA_END=402 /DNA_ORIENTATION=+
MAALEIWKSYPLAPTEHIIPCDFQHPLCVVLWERRWQILGRSRIFCLLLERRPFDFRLARAQAVVFLHAARRCVGRSPVPPLGRAHGQEDDGRREHPDEDPSD